MRSRLFIGVSAWLLGAVTATAGSMLAVGHLAHGVLGPDTQQQLTATAVSTDLRSYQHRSPAAHPAPRARPASPRPAGPRVPAKHHRAPAASESASSQAGTLLDSDAGSVTASCQAGGAYLLYWIPDQGYRADDWARGPAAVASVTFENSAGGIVMRVTCSGSVPVAHITQIPRDDNSGGGNE